MGQGEGLAISDRKVAVTLFSNSVAIVFCVREGMGLETQPRVNGIRIYQWSFIK